MSKHIEERVADIETAGSILINHVIESLTKYNNNNIDLTAEFNSFLEEAIIVQSTLPDELLFKYSDGYINTPKEIGTPGGYSDSWLKQVG